MGRTEAAGLLSHRSTASRWARQRRWQKAKAPIRRH